MVNLLINDLNCRIALFTRKYVSFNKKDRVKSIRLAVLRRIP